MALKNLRFKISSWRLHQHTHTHTSTHRQPQRPVQDNFVISKFTRRHCLKKPQKSEHRICTGPAITVLAKQMIGAVPPLLKQEQFCTVGTVWKSAAHCAKPDQAHDGISQSQFATWLLRQLHSYVAVKKEGHGTGSRPALNQLND